LLQEPDRPELRLGGMVCLGAGGFLKVIPFDDLADPDTGRTKIRLVDTDSEVYRVAREYMLRLEPTDLEDPEMLEGVARLTGETPEEVRARFSPALGVVP